MVGVLEVLRHRVPIRGRMVLSTWAAGHPRFRRFLASGRELDVIETEVRDSGKGAWRSFRNPSSTIGATERVVEIPWVLSRYRGERRVLEVGAAFALPWYTRHLVGLGIPELHGVDLSPRRVKGVTMTRADVRKTPYPDAHFDLIICISTLEHIGRNNVRYQVAAPVERDGDLQALRELGRVVHDRGRILVTVPFGRLEYHSWFKQYDLPSWDALVASANLRVLEQAIYAYSPSGWSPASEVQGLPSHSYQEMGAPGATGVLCAALAR